MPVKDESRWTENEDGSWSRIIPNAAEISEAELLGVAPINATTGALAAAEKLGVDLATVSGTGKDGKITKADVEAAAS